MYIKSAEDLKWEARHDARIIAEASIIQKDKERLNRAKIAAADLVKEQEDELKNRHLEIANMKQLANGSAPRKSNVSSDPFGFPREVTQLNIKRGRW